MNLNDYIANIVSLAECCEDEKTKDILLSHLTGVLSTQSQKLTYIKIQEDPVDSVYQIAFECYECGHIDALELNFIEGKKYLTTCSRCEGLIEINP